jgi:hypothetical protein
LKLPLALANGTETENLKGFSRIRIKNEAKALSRFGCFIRQLKLTAIDIFLPLIRIISDYY